MTRIVRLVSLLALSFAMQSLSLPAQAVQPGPAMDAVERLAESVRFRTISHQDVKLVDYHEFERLHEFLRESFPRVFAAFEVETVNGYSLLLHWPGTEPSLQPVLFTAHMDVVPIEPGTEQDWAYPPFDGVVAEGRIHGRGTLDDKQGMMGLLEAAESLLSEGYRPQRSLVFAFGHDEEIGGREGAARLAQRMRERNWRFAWMVDEGGMLLAGNPLLPERQIAMINIAEKAYVTLTLVATGEGGHSSRPPPVSTIGRLSAALARIENHPFPPRLPEPVVGMLQAMAPHMSQPERFIFSNLWLTGGLVADRMAEEALTNSFVRSTTALTMFNAGVKENVVPQRAEAKVNFRLLPGDTPAQLLQRVENIVDDPEIEILHDDWDNVPPVSDVDGPGFRAIAEAVAEVYPDALIVPSLLTATTDTRHYVALADDQYRFHGMLIDASQADTVHGTGEYIATQSYLDSIAVARAMLRLGSSR
ncbi:MAG: M20/M25/M40 family metallo-hydrolase [Halioglobus sp.]